MYTFTEDPMSGTLTWDIVKKTYDKLQQQSALMTREQFEEDRQFFMNHFYRPLTDEQWNELVKKNPYRCKQEFIPIITN